MKIVDSKNFKSNFVPKKELQKMLKALRLANKRNTKFTIFEIIKVKADKNGNGGYDVLTPVFKGGSLKMKARVLKARVFGSAYYVDYDKYLFI